MIISNHPIWLIQMIFGSLSIVSCIFNLVMFLFLEGVKSEATELIFYLSISSIITNISYIMNFEDKGISDGRNAVCQIQGFLILWFDLSQVIWATLVCYSVYLYIVINSEYNKCRRIKYIIIGFIIPFAISLALLCFGLVGSGKYFCWLDIDKNINYVLGIIIYCFSWIFFFFSIYFIQRVIFFLEKNFTDKQEKEIICNYIQKIRIYPIIQCLSILPTTISFMFSEDVLKRNIIFDYWDTIFISLQGLFYTIVFGLNPIIKNRIQEILHKCCCFNQEEDLIRENYNSNELPTSKSTISDSEMEKN